MDVGDGKLAGLERFDGRIHVRRSVSCVAEAARERGRQCRESVQTIQMSRLGEEVRTETGDVLCGCEGERTRPRPSPEESQKHGTSIISRLDLEVLSSELSCTYRSWFVPVVPLSMS